MKGVRGQSWYLDDIPEGYVHLFGQAPLTFEDVALFKSRFAPSLPMHGETDDAEIAAQGHVYAIWTRLVWEQTKDWPVLARLGQDALRWYGAARAGDTLSVRLTMTAKQLTGEDKGILFAQHEVLNQAGKLVLSLMTRTVLARTPD